jgi:hypothetical protein
MQGRWPTEAAYQAKLKPGQRLLYEVTSALDGANSTARWGCCWSQPGARDSNATDNDVLSDVNGGGRSRV